MEAGYGSVSISSLGLISNIAVFNGDDREFCIFTAGCKKRLSKKFLAS